MKNLLFLFCLLSTSLLAQGVRGFVYTADGEPLPYATIYIPALETGSSTNQDGRYELELSRGKYKLVFQYMGYQTMVKEVQVEDQFVRLNVSLPEQAIQLREVEVVAGSEDPAYTIMRKAIAKSKFHDLQVQSYQAKVYIKGAGRIKDMPWLLEKSMKDEGIDSSTVFLTESVSKLKFEQPDKITEEVISIRDIGDQNNTDPNGFINGSLYKSDVAGSISPLSPRAFAYYKFRYAGSFIDRDHEINKIRVIPRSRGDDVFDGYIYIIEDLWSIHSVNMHTYKQGFKVDINQIYAPIRERVWMPVSHRIEIDAKVFGIAFEYKYLATLSDYDITLNPDLKVPELVVVDEKIDKELAAALEKEEKLETGEISLDSTGLFSEKRQFTRKELRKTLRAYEKELEDMEEEPDVVEYRSMNIDSAAYNQDSSYWASIRPVPLSSMEAKSYRKLDSMAVAEQQEEENKKQTEASGDNGGQVNQGLGSIVFGTTFELGKNTSLEYKSPLSEFGFNTVEGYHIALPLILRTKLFEQGFRAEPTVRYAFARQKLIGKMGLHYSINDHYFSLAGGRYVNQFNEKGPIHPLINTFSTLWLEQNFIKIYQKDFARLGWRHGFSDKFRLEARVAWEERMQLFNNTSHSWLDQEETDYSPNSPENLGLADTSFPLHNAFLGFLEAKFQPFLKYRVRNGNKSIINERSPEFRLTYRKGLPDVLDSQVDFDLLELGIRHRLEIGVRGRLDYNVYAGAFLNNQSLYFMDFHHFMGNRTILQIGDPVESFRLLDYYRYSTDKQYVAGNFYYQFRRLLLTQIFEVQLLGIKENILFNYLKTDLSPHYMELGYSLDNIFRFMRIEAVVNFEDGRYQDFGVRVGVSTSLEVIFD